MMHRIHISFDLCGCFVCCERLIIQLEMLSWYRWKLKRESEAHTFFGAVSKSHPNRPCVCARAHTQCWVMAKWDKNKAQGINMRVPAHIRNATDKICFLSKYSSQQTNDIEHVVHVNLVARRCVTVAAATAAKPSASHVLLRRRETRNLIIWHAIKFP